MRYVMHFGPDALMIEMTGDFSFTDTKQFHGMLVAIKNGEGRDIIKLNVSQLDSIDATALRLLMMAHDFAKKAHRSLIFVSPQGQVSKALNEAAQYNMLNIAA